MTKFHIYNPQDKAEQEIAKAAKEAKEQHKNVLIQIGGNWCIWCARLNDLMSRDASVDSMLKANYVVYHMNFSRENYNTKLLAKYGYPHRLGIPVLLVLDADGNRIHTQNTGYLENGNGGYDRDKVMGFLYDWSPAALDPKKYKE